MNSFSLGISGSVWILLVVSILIIALTLYSYRETTPPISKGKKSILVTLRILGLLILLFAIFQPILTSITGENIPPKTAILFDNSESMTLKDNSVDRSKVSETIKGELKQLDLETELYSFGENFSDIDSYDSLSFKSQRTDISKAIRELDYKLDTGNVQSVILVTDGSYNTGSNPLYASEKLGRPIITIGIGDTTEPRDIIVDELLTNEVGYVNTPNPVIANIKTNQISKKELPIRLYADNELITEEKIDIYEEQESYNVKFSYTPKEGGNIKLRVEAEGLEEEITTKNNSRTEIVKVLENKRNIALFSGKPSYEVSFLMKYLNNDKSREVSKFIQEKDGSFINEFNISDLKRAEMLVLVGFPNKYTNTKYLELIENELKKGKPLFYISSNDIDYQKLNNLSSFLPFEVLSSSQQELEIIADANKDLLSSSILRINNNKDDARLWNDLPPIYKTETFYKINPEASVLMNYRVNDVKLDEPLVVSNKFGNTKALFVLGYGLYRWKLLGYAKEIAKGNEVPDLYTRFMNNSFKWLSIDKEFKNFTVKTDKKQYVNNENITFFAQLYDESYQPLEGAEIVVSLRTKTDSTREILLDDIGNGQYQTEISSLPEGTYSYSATAVYENSKIAEDKSKFTVGNLNIEYSDYTVEKDLLQSMSEISGGSFFHNTTSGIEEFIKNLDNYKTRHLTYKDELDIWNLPILLIISILLLSTEWLLRKLYGMI